MLPLFKICIFATLAIIATACPKGRSKDANEAPLVAPVDNLEPVEAGRSLTEDIKLDVDLRTDQTIVIKIEDALESGDEFICHLNKAPISPCHHDAVIANPGPGTYVLAVTAKRGETVTGIGEIRFTIEDPDSVPSNPTRLALEIKNDDLENGAAIKNTADLTILFELAGDATCPGEVSFQCKYDSRSSPFWIPCDTGAFTIKQELQAAGLQTFSAQAACGEELGPILTLEWYGVPDDYKPLMLRVMKDPANQHIVNLIKADDCPGSQQVFECAATQNDPFLPCKGEGGNVLKSPTAGTRVRIACGDIYGPVLTIE